MLFGSYLEKLTTGIMLSERVRGQVPRCSRVTLQLPRILEIFFFIFFLPFRSLLLGVVVVQTPPHPGDTANLRRDLIYNVTLSGRGAAGRGAAGRRRMGRESRAVETGGNT